MFFWYLLLYANLSVPFFTWEARSCRFTHAADQHCCWIFDIWTVWLDHWWAICFCPNSNVRCCVLFLLCCSFWGVWPLKLSKDHSVPAINCLLFFCVLWWSRGWFLGVKMKTWAVISVDKDTWVVRGGRWFWLGCRRFPVIFSFWNLWGRAISFKIKYDNVNNYNY